MTHQRAEYPLDYSKTADRPAGDRVQNAADAAADKVADVAGQCPRTRRQGDGTGAANTPSRHRKRPRTSSPLSRSR